MEEMIKNITIISTMIITIIYSIYRYFRVRKTKKIKYDAVEKLSKEIQRLKYEKKREQSRIVSERSDILYSEFLKTFCKCMGASEDSREAQLYDSYILNNVRQKTDDLMDEAIEMNNMAERSGDDWTNYKKRKFEYILTKIIKYIKEIWKNEILGYEHELVVQTCRTGIIEVYMIHINSMFEEIKNISIKYEEEIKSQTKLLNSIKDEKTGLLKG